MKLSSPAIAAGLVATLLVSGCARSSGGGDSPAVDPQVLKDVVAATFRVPGDEVRRAMRVDRFTRELAITECGGTAGPLDDTSGRVDQSKYPDLDLIRERGFSETEETQKEDARLESLDDCTDLRPDLKAFDDWSKLQGPWNDITLAVEQDSRLDPLKQPLADCLTQRTGLPVDAADPVISYLRAVNISASKDATDAQNAERAVAYADCAAPYFAELHTLLLAKRPAMVERHREVITRYAAQLIGAGYAP